MESAAATILILLTLVIPFKSGVVYDVKTYESLETISICDETDDVVDVVEAAPKVISFVLGQDKVNIDGVYKDISAPVVYNYDDDRVLIPIRAVSEALGYDVAWTEDTGTIVISDDANAVTLWLDYAFIAINGDISVMDTATVIIGESTYIPIRYVAEAFELEVDWNENESKVTLRSQ